jgi:hypothetical protein
LRSSLFTGAWARFSALIRSDNFEWDFRAHVRVLNLNPPGKAAAPDFVVYTQQQYTPPAQASSDRKLTPTKVAATGAPPSSDYVAIFEITTTADWSATRKKMLMRLESRLRVSLDRARHETPSINAIKDVCAVIGVVSPRSCADSVCAQMSTSASKVPLLTELMLLGRFVWLQRPFASSPSPV